MNPRLWGDLGAATPATPNEERSKGAIPKAKRDGRVTKNSTPKTSQPKTMNLNLSGAGDVTGEAIGSIRLSQFIMLVLARYQVFLLRFLVRRTIL